MPIAETKKPTMRVAASIPRGPIRASTTLATRRTTYVTSIAANIARGRDQALLAGAGPAEGAAATDRAATEARRGELVAHEAQGRPDGLARGCPEVEGRVVNGGINPGPGPLPPTGRTATVD